MTDPKTDALVNSVVDPIVNAFEVLSKNTFNNDRALFELIKVLMDRVEVLGNQVDMLMDLHRLEEHKDEVN
jgi:hypothetical protein